MISRPLTFRLAYVRKRMDVLIIFSHNDLTNSSYICHEHTL